MSRLRPTWVEVDLGAIRHNVGVLKPESAELMAVVKADAYAHGDVAVARAALEGGASWIGVALVEEGLRLRDGGIEAPILVLSEFPPGSEVVAIAAGLTPSLYSEAALERLAVAAAGRHVGVHVKVDTGMHRVGVYPPEATKGFVERRFLRRPAPGGVVDPFRQLLRGREDHARAAGDLPGDRRGRAVGGAYDRRCSTRRTAAPPSCTRRPTSTSSGPASRSTARSPLPASPTAWGCARRSRGVRRSARPSGCPPGNACRTDTDTSWSAMRTSPRCRSATPTATLACCRAGPTS